MLFRQIHNMGISGSSNPLRRQLFAHSRSFPCCICLPDSWGLPFCVGCCRIWLYLIRHGIKRWGTGTFFAIYCVSVGAGLCLAIGLRPRPFAILFNRLTKTCLTSSISFTDVSTNEIPHLFAKERPSSSVTCRATDLSFMFPTSTIGTADREADTIGACVYEADDKHIHLGVVVEYV